jgi:hypothetical protein
MKNIAKKINVYCSIFAESKNCVANRQPLLGKSSTNMPIAGQQLHKHAAIPEASLSNMPMQKWRNF